MEERYIEKIDPHAAHIVRLDLLPNPLTLLILLLLFRFLTRPIRVFQPDKFFSASKYFGPVDLPSSFHPVFGRAPTSQNPVHPGQDDLDKLPVRIANFTRKEWLDDLAIGGLARASTDRSTDV